MWAQQYEQYTDREIFHYSAHQIQDGCIVQSKLPRAHWIQTSEDAPEAVEPLKTDVVGHQVSDSLQEQGVFRGLPLSEHFQYDLCGLSSHVPF